MHDNPQHAPDRDFRLSGYGVVSLQGPDAVSFAQAQFTTDVASLEPGAWHWSCWLTPKGRVIALFALLRLAPDVLWLVLPDETPDALAAALRRFVFRARVTITTHPEIIAAGRFGRSADATGNRLAHGGAGAIELDLGGATLQRTLSLTPLPAGDDPALEARWRRCDLEHGLPRLPEGQADQWTPQQLSLDRLGAYSVRKGCYPGQEIVARTHFLGKAKRALALFEASPTPEPGAEVADDGRAVGTIVSAAPPLALAVLSLDRSGGTLTSGDVTLHGRSLLPGLGR